MVIRQPTPALMMLLGERTHIGKRLAEAQAKGVQRDIDHWEAEFEKIEKRIIREGGDPLP
jgi:hypothetical protein